MQLNVYIPKGKATILESLKRVARQTGRPKNDLILDAIERYVSETRPVLGRFHLGVKPLGRRAQWYEGRLSR